MVDGKCAYTILLPVNSCPHHDYIQQPPDGLPVDENLQQTLGQLESNLVLVTTNLTQVTAWLGEQSRLITQLQSSVMTLQNATVSEGQISELQTMLGQQGQVLMALESQVGAAMEDLSTEQLRTQALMEDLTELTNSQADLAQTVEQNSALVAEQQTTINTLSDALSDFQTRYATSLCETRGLVVSGTQVSILDSQIQVSSQYNEQHGGDRGRIFINEAPGAWCPSKCLDYY